MVTNALEISGIEFVYRKPISKTKREIINPKIGKEVGKKPIFDKTNKQQLINRLKNKT